LFVDAGAVRHGYEQALEHVAGAANGDPVDPSWRVTLHFHPDRLVDGVPILERMARDGVYRSQFETGVSNGGLTAYPGGERWRWESRIFGADYDDGPPASRPKYGSLNFRRRRVGGSPRFGSAHLRLTADALARATFCYPDSAAGPERFGIAARMSSLVKLAEADDRDPLDDYIEAHVHGPIDITSDVEAWTPAIVRPRSRTQRAGWAARSSGTVASPSRPTRFWRTPGTAGPSSRAWAHRSPAAKRSRPASSVTRPAPAATTSRH
jgi:hypothetical protein